MVVGELTTEVDVAIIGAGPGGYIAAIRAAQLGKLVAIVDPHAPGGSCLREHCIPSKALLHASGQAHQLTQLGPLGIAVGEPTIDFSAMQAWKGSVVGKLTKGVAQLLKSHNIEIVKGTGQFKSRNEVWVEGFHGASTIRFEQAIIAVGAGMAPLPGLPYDGERVLTPAQLLKLETRPETLTLVGSDYVVAEMATIFAKLGTAVRLLVPVDAQFLHGFDVTAGRQVLAGLKRLGVKVEQKVADVPTAVADAPLVVVSAGRCPRTEGLKLNKVGVETDPQGFILVSETQQTNNPQIFAVGDVTGGLPLASLAIKQGKVAAEVIGGLPAAFEPQAIPRVIFTDPEVAAVGVSAAQAEALGYTVKQGRFPMGANGFAQTLDAAVGTVLTVADADNDVLLGATIIAPQAASLIGEAALALEMGATLTDLSETLHPHPSLGESLLGSIEVVLGKAVDVVVK